MGAAAAAKVDGLRRRGSKRRRAAAAVAAASGGGGGDLESGLAFAGAVGGGAVGRGERRWRVVRGALCRCGVRREEVPRLQHSAKQSTESVPVRTMASG